MAARATSGAIVSVDGRTLALSNQDKVLFPEDGFTKGDLVQYYRAISDFILPYLQDRPLTLERFPDGIEAPSFFEKHAPRGLPPWVPTVSIRSETSRHNTVDYIVCNNESTLTYVANLAAIVLHVWTSRVGSLDVPDFVLFDLDPTPDCTIATLARVALRLRAGLESIGLRPLVKTTGGKGLHIVIPLESRYHYDDAKVFAEIVSRRMHGELPALTTLERSVAKRPAGTVYLDWVQVGEGKTMVAPFSVRARRKAPVSMPLEWDNVEALGRKRARDTQGPLAAYTIKNVPTLLAQGGDPWSGSGWKRQRLEPALKRARTLWSTSKGA